MPGAPSSFLLLVAMPFAPSSVLILPEQKRRPPGQPTFLGENEEVLSASYLGHSGRSERRYKALDSLIGVRNCDHPITRTRTIEEDQTY